MGREQMRNLEVFRTSGTQINEFEYQKNQGEITDQEHPGKQGGSAKRLTQAERVKQVMAAAHDKVEKRRKREAAKTGSKKSGGSKKTGGSKKAATTRRNAKK